MPGDPGELVPHAASTDLLVRAVWCCGCFAAGLDEVTTMMAP